VPTSLLSIAILFFFPLSSFALGLGDVHVESRLNEKLSAKIDITSATERDLESLDVSFASDNDYQRSGFDKSDYTYKINIKVNNEGNKNYILLTSEDVFREPLLQLLLDVQWYSGRLLKDYSIFLDPPDVKKYAPTPIRSVISEPASNKKKTTPLEANQVETEQKKIRKVTHDAKLDKSSGKLVYGPTVRSDTLWQIAVKMRPTSSFC